MTNKNLLAILRPGDENHHLVKDFFQSLPEKTTKVFDSFGYIGNLESNLRKFTEEHRRHYLIFRSPSCDDLDENYFSSTPKAALMKIPDKLIVKVNYKQQNTDCVVGVRLVDECKGGIDAVVELYDKLSSANPRELLVNKLNEDKTFREKMTKRKWFNFGKTKTFPLYISVGLETPDGRYLLGTTRAQGPYVFTSGK